MTASLYGEGSRPSNAGIAHYVQMLSNSVNCGRSGAATCNKFSKFRAAIFFISDALLANFRMELTPKVGICRNL